MIRKIFLSTLVLLPSIANAADVELKASGSTNTFYGYSDLSERYEKKDNNNALTNTTKLSLSAEKELNDDYKVGAYLDLMVGFNKGAYDFNNGSWGKELYTTLDAPAGRLMLGETYNVAEQFAVQAPKAGSFDFTDFIANPNWVRNKHSTGYKTLNSTAINTDGVAPKVTYITPEFYSSYFGITYINDIDNRRGLTNSHAKYDDKQGYVASLYTNHEIGFFDVTASAGFAEFRSDDKEMSAGLSASRGGWTVGGSYRKTYIDGKKEFITTRYIDKQRPELFDNYREGKAWDVGVGYEIGPYKVALSYFNAKADNTDNEDKMVMLSNKYQYNKYVDVYLAAAHVEYQGENKSVDSNNKGYSFITGLGLNF